jgi:hypothetical protein
MLKPETGEHSLHRAQLCTLYSLKGRTEFIFNLKNSFFLEEIQMAKKHMKKCSPSLAIKEMQIKTTPRFHLTPARIAIISNTTNNRFW